MDRFEVRPDGFYADDGPVRLLSGAMHYFRIHPDQWRQRIEWARHMGLNAIETYVPWNLHSPTPRTRDFTGMLDVGGYLRAVADAGLMAIVRPGPYICAELDFGGLPAWLLADHKMRVRSDDPRYLAEVDRWFDDLFEILVPLQAGAGGPIVLMQLENEFGAYGDDTGYLDKLYRTMLEKGVTVPLVTSDQLDERMLANGGHPRALRTVNFGSEPVRGFETLRRHQPDGPLMCMEFWNGWFDHWGEQHHTRPAADAAGVLDEMLQLGASVNFYMFCGGTNFGFTNGANHEGAYQPTVTSYDYDAPLSEDGCPTAKFWAYRDVLARHTGVPPAGDAPTLASRLAPVEVTCRPGVPLIEALPKLTQPRPVTLPVTMEDLGQNHGFLVYELGFDQPGQHTLSVTGLADRAQILVDGEEAGVLDRESGRTTAVIGWQTAPTTVHLVVENLGRVNYGPHLVDRKGIGGQIRVDGVPVPSAVVHPLALDRLDDHVVAAEQFPGPPDPAGPRFWTGSLTVDEPADGFVHLPGWTKGVVWVNGFNLGRYWSRGPQRSLYLPGPVLHPGANSLVVLELHRTGSPTLTVTGRPDLG